MSSLKWQPAVSGLNMPGHLEQALRDEAAGKSVLMSSMGKAARKELSQRRLPKTPEQARGWRW